MLEEGAECEDAPTQLAAVDKAIARSGYFAGGHRFAALHAHRGPKRRPGRLSASSSRWPESGQVR